jgi:hypothetical protein
MPRRILHPLPAPKLPAGKKLKADMSPTVTFMGFSFPFDQLLTPFTGLWATFGLCQTLVQTIAPDPLRYSP